MDSLLSVFASIWSWDVKGLLLFMVIFILVADYIKNRQPASFPPGPRALPIIGNIFSVNHKQLHVSCAQLAEKHGNVFSLRMGQGWLVVLNGFKVLKEALVNQGDSVIDRPAPPLQIYVGNGKIVQGVILSNDNVWKQQRRFTLSTFKYFGFGKKLLEPVILDEFENCAKEIRRFYGKPFNPHFMLNNVIANIICHLVFGRRFEYDDENFGKLLRTFDSSFEIEASIWAQLYNAFPWLMKRLPGPHQTLKKNYSEVNKFTAEKIKEHKRNLDPSDPRDYIDCFLIEIEKTKAEPDSSFYEENLVWCVLDLFLAGSETTSTTLRWALLYMSKYPEIQEKVQAEIDSVIGQSRQPTMDDRANMPYADAVIHEIQRFSNIAPLALPHITNKELQLEGYTVPKGVVIIPNLTSVLFDKNEWETPHTFNPGHFLTEDGRFRKRAAFLPFSAGKRLCLGESLAKMELFLFFTSFLQHFTFQMPAGVKPVLDYRFGVTLAPLAYKICAIPR